MIKQAELLKKMEVVANWLDDCGLVKEASDIDAMMVKIAAWYNVVFNKMAKYFGSESWFQNLIQIMKKDATGVESSLSKSVKTVCAKVSNGESISEIEKPIVRIIKEIYDVYKSNAWIQKVIKPYIPLIEDVGPKLVEHI